MVTDYTGMIGMAMLASMMRGVMLQTSGRIDRAKVAVRKTKEILRHIPIHCIICGEYVDSEAGFFRHLYEYDCLEILEGQFSLGKISATTFFPISFRRPRRKRTPEELLIEERSRELGLNYTEGEVRRIDRIEQWGSPEALPKRRVYIGSKAVKSGDKAFASLIFKGLTPSEYMIRTVPGERVIYVPFDQTEEFLGHLASMIRILEGGELSTKKPARHYVSEMATFFKFPGRRPRSISFGVSFLPGEKGYVLIESMTVVPPFTLVKLPPAVVKRITSAIGEDYFERTRIVGQSR